MKLSIVGFTFFFFIGAFSLTAQQLATAKKIAPKNYKAPVDTVVTEIINGRGTVDQIEIDKLIVNETISKAGYDFLELFNAFWNWPATSNESFIIVITERPFRGISTQVVISVNDLVVFESFLQARYDFLEYLAEAATEQTTNYLVNYANIVKELEGEDTKGNGIY